MDKNTNSLQPVLNFLMFRQLTEGLIHNLNTPLNLILGYTQQLKKQFPDVPFLDKIYDAGVQIDDLLHTSYSQNLIKLDTHERKIELRQWLQNELKLISNWLEIKHNLKIKTILPARETPVFTKPQLLSLCFESIMLLINQQSKIEKEKDIKIELTASETAAELSLQSPVIGKIECCQEKLDDCLQIFSEISQSADAQTPLFPLVVSTNTIIIHLQKAK